MSIHPSRLDADLYQLSGEESAQEHIAGSGALNVAGLYANHGSEATTHAFVAESELGLHQAAVAYHPQLGEHAFHAPVGDNYYSSLSQALNNIAHPNATSGTATLLDEVAPVLTSMPAHGLSAAALGTLGNKLNGAGIGGLGGSNGTNGTSGGPGTNGSNGHDGHEGGGHCSPFPLPHCEGPGHGGHGNTTINVIGGDVINTTVNNVTNITNTIVNEVHNHAGGTNLIDIDIFHNETHNHNQTLIDIDLGGGHHAGGNDNNIIDIDLGDHSHTVGNDNDILDLNLGGSHDVTGNDNDLIDLGLGGSSHIGGNDNDVIDLGLGNHNVVAGHDNDIIDLGLGGQSDIGGNDNDLIDLGLLDSNNVQGNDNDLLDLTTGGGNNVGGNDNDLIDLGLLNQSNVQGDDNDLIDLGLGGQQHTGGTDNDFIDIGLNDHNTADGGNHDAIGLDLDLLDNGNIAGVDLNLGSFDVADVGFNEQGASVDLHLGIADVHLDTGDLLVHDASEGLLPDNLNIDLGLNDLGTGLGQGDNGLLDALGLNNDPSHLSTDHGGGTVLGLQLGLGAWV